MSLKNKKILAIIPARGGSKKLPQKNIKKFATDNAREIGFIRHAKY